MDYGAASAMLSLIWTGTVRCWPGTLGRGPLAGDLCTLAGDLCALAGDRMIWIWPGTPRYAIWHMDGDRVFLIIRRVV